uniref:Uncharacterized protein n=1 Tax=Knipowitschia caucasica TaxID=637954 RepID=A0AAV2IU77_KNICA
MKMIPPGWTWCSVGLSGRRHGLKRGWCAERGTLLSLLGRARSFALCKVTLLPGTLPLTLAATKRQQTPQKTTVRQNIADNNVIPVKAWKCK